MSQGPAPPGQPPFVPPPPPPPHYADQGNMPHQPRGGFAQFSGPPPVQQFQDMSLRSPRGSQFMPFDSSRSVSTYSPYSDSYSGSSSKSGRSTGYEAWLLTKDPRPYTGPPRWELTLKKPLNYSREKLVEMVKKQQKSIGSVEKQLQKLPSRMQREEIDLFLKEKCMEEKERNPNLQWEIASVKAKRTNTVDIKKREQRRETEEIRIVFKWTDEFETANRRDSGASRPITFDRLRSLESNYSPIDKFDHYNRRNSSYQQNGQFVVSNQNFRDSYVHPSNQYTARSPPSHHTGHNGSISQQAFSGPQSQAHGMSQTMLPPFPAPQAAPNGPLPQQGFPGPQFQSQGMNRPEPPRHDAFVPVQGAPGNSNPAFNTHPPPFSQSNPPPRGPMPSFPPPPPPLPVNNGNGKPSQPGTSQKQGLLPTQNGPKKDSHSKANQSIPVVVHCFDDDSSSQESVGHRNWQSSAESEDNWTPESSPRNSGTFMGHKAKSSSRGQMGRRGSQSNQAIRRQHSDEALSQVHEIRTSRSDKSGKGPKYPYEIKSRKRDHKSSTSTRRPQRRIMETAAYQGHHDRNARRASGGAVRDESESETSEDYQVASRDRGTRRKGRKYSNSESRRHYS